jgi:hypothetical protein
MSLSIRVFAVISTIAMVLSFASCSGFFVDPTIVSLSVTPASPSLVKGQTQQFSAVATYDDGSTKVLSDAVWTTSSVTTMIVNSTGLATALSSGSVTISASSGIATGSTTVSIVDSPLTALNISPLNPSLSLAGTRTQQFSATGTFADGSSRDITSSVTWTSSNTAVASISTIGLASAATEGTSDIKATSGTISATTTLTVTK